MQKNRIITTAKSVIIYDGECGFCNKFIILIAKNDTNSVFLFTPNNSSFAKSIFEKKNINPKFAEETIFLYTEEDLYTKGEAIKEIFKKIHKYRYLYLVLQLLNSHIIDWGYSMFSKIRKKIQPNQCEIPSKEIIEKFILQ